MNDNTINKPRVIAFYLPQFHPTPDNDKWWGKGFTEWTNVGKAKPLFRGHYQPRVPADLGYYDLRLPEVREAQAELAREAGIEGFCYYHYWFGNGKQELELPFNEVLKSGKPDFPFCLCWANESWHSKFWNRDGTVDKKLLIEQKYDDDEGIRQHFYHLLPAFKDKRYIRVDNKPLFMIYKPLDFPDVEHFMNVWNDLAKENELDGICFIAQTITPNMKSVREILGMGFYAVNTVGLWSARDYNSVGVKIIRKIKTLLGFLSVRKYKDMYPRFISAVDKCENVYPTIIPNWDHTPRSGAAGYVIDSSTPNLFAKHVEQVLLTIKNKKKENQIIFLKSWNEWGEGNYMEPDLKWGKKYLEALRDELKNYCNH